MNIAVIGNSHFGPILRQQLSEYDQENRYTFYNTNEKKLDKLKFALNIFSIDIVYSVSASISGGGALNLASMFNKKIVQHFIGSDVLSAREDYKNGNISQKLMQQTTYLCEVDWIKDELNEIEVDADIVSIMAYEQIEEPKPFKDFSVLTYMGKGKEEFYGVNDFIKLAQNFPDVEFKIAGIEYYVGLPENIKCLGWINMIEELQKTVVFIRNAEHDGLGFSVIESLSLGRITLYNYNFSHVNYFKNSNELVEIMTNIQSDFNEKKLEVNTEAIEFVKREYSSEYVMNKLVKKIV